MTPEDQLRQRMVELAADSDRPVVAAIDGRSGAGKSTLAASLRSRPPIHSPDPSRPPVSVIDGDDFYSGGSSAVWDAMSAREKIDHVIDWRRQRRVVEQIRHGQIARWRPFDWQAFDGRLADHELSCPPSPVVILEGAYSARPELADLLDLRVLLDTPEAVRRRRLVAREGADYADDWFDRWTEAEELYFGSIMPPDSFDLVLR